MGITNKTKKFLCKSFGKYRDGAIRVTYWQVIILSAMILFALYFLISLAIEFIGIFIVDPIKAVSGLLFVIGIVLGFGLGMVLLGKFFTSKLFERITFSFFTLMSKDAIVCDRMIQSEEVKKIFDEIIALDDEKKSEFLKGIDSLMRRLVP